jgi:hypothetical protein
MSSDTPTNDTPESLSNAKSGPPEITLTDFFVKVPPGGMRVISQSSLRWLKPREEEQGEDPEHPEPPPDKEFMLPELELDCP